MYTLNSKGVRVECIVEDLIIPAEDDAALGHFILLIMHEFWKTSQSWISERGYPLKAGQWGVGQVR